jgi:hypothetical protein
MKLKLVILFSIRALLIGNSSAKIWPVWNLPVIWIISILYDILLGGEEQSV